MAGGLRRGQLLFNRGIFLGVLETEAEVFELRLDFVEPQTVGQRRIDVKRLTGNLVLLVGRLRLQCAHVVQAVGNLDEDDANVVAHGEQQFLEVLGLGRSLFAKDAAADFRQSVYNLRNLGTEDVLDVLNGVVGVFDDVVEQGRANAGGAQPDFAARNLCYGDGVHDVWFARQSAHTLVCLPGKVEGFGNEVHFLAVARSQIVVQQLLECAVNHLFVGGLSLQ